MAPQGGPQSHTGVGLAASSLDREQAALAAVRTLGRCNGPMAVQVSRAVSFAAACSVQLIPTASELIDECDGRAEILWNTPEDTARMEREMVLSVKAHRKGNIDENSPGRGGEHTIRGLEHLKSPRDLRLRKESKEGAADAVLDEQDRQIGAGVVRWCDESIREAYVPAVEGSRVEALERGASDAAYVREVVVLPMLRQKLKQEQMKLKSMLNKPRTTLSPQQQQQPSPQQRRAATLAEEELPARPQQQQQPQPHPPRRHSHSALGGMLARMNNLNNRDDVRRKSFSAAQRAGGGTGAGGARAGAVCASLLEKALDLTNVPPSSTAGQGSPSVPAARMTPAGEEKKDGSSSSASALFVAPKSAEKFNSRSARVTIRGLAAAGAHPTHRAKGKHNGGGGNFQPKRAALLAAHPRQQQQPSTF